MSRGFSGPKPAEIRGGLGVDRSITSEVVPTASQAGAFSQQDKQNTGYSGTPMWKLALEKQKEQQIAASNGPAVKIPEGFTPADKLAMAQMPARGQWYFSEKRQLFWNSLDSRMYVFDHVSGKYQELYEAKTYELKIAVGSCFHDKATQVRHVLVKDLAKAAQALRIPIEHLDRPCALYALYDGHRGTSNVQGVGNVCAEFCVRHLHQILLPKLAGYRGFWDDQRLVVAMQESFEELDREFTERHPSIVDGCCVAVALVLGQRLILANAGDVACVLCTRSGDAVGQFQAHVTRNAEADESGSEDSEDHHALPISGGCDVSCQGSAPKVRWTRALGNQDCKIRGSNPMLSATPDVSVLNLEPKHQGVALISRALYNAIGKNAAVSTVFRRSGGRPRMAAGALVDAAVQWLGQVGDISLGSVVVFFDKVETVIAPPCKKAKGEQPSQMRLRHIMLKHRECKSTVDKVRNRQVKRSRGEAERVLRSVLEECEGDQRHKIFTQRCKDLSECPTSLSAGGLAGDLGWVKFGKGKFGLAFDAAAALLQVGQISDLVDSDQGIHVIMRSA